MDSKYLNSNSIDSHPDLVSVNKIILFNSSWAVERYVENIAPFFFNAVLVAADGSYPKNPMLRKRVYAALKNDPRCIVVVMNRDALGKIEVKTERIFVLDSVLMSAYRFYEPHREFRLDLSAQQISTLIQSYFSQWDNLKSESNFSLAHSAGRRFDQPSIADWRFEMMGLSPVMFIFDEIFFRETVYLRHRLFLASLENFSTEEMSQFDQISQSQEESCHYFSVLNKVSNEAIGGCRVVYEDGEIRLSFLRFLPEYNEEEVYSRFFHALKKHFAGSLRLVVKMDSEEFRPFLSLGYEVTDGFASRICVD